VNDNLTHFEVDADGIALLAMRDLEGKNALSLAMVEELEARCREISHHESIKVLIVTGTDEYFSTGADLEVLRQLLRGKVTPRDLLLPRALLDISAPVIAAMGGHAIGGGLALGLCADLTVLARESRYAANFMNYGFTPGLGTTRLLEHLLGPSLAHEMLLTGRAFRGSHFEGKPGFSYVLPRQDVMKKASELASIIAEKPRTSLLSLKFALSARKRELFEAARSSETLMHQITLPLPEVESLICEFLEEAAAIEL
jgi:polyketide biosynthesis enoyl-CoA hydratase PksI